MKTLAALVVLLSVSAFSTVIAQDLMTYGFKLGAIHAEQRWNNSAQSLIHSSGTHAIWGFDAGAFLGYTLIRNIGVLAESHYVQRGMSVTVMATARDDNPQGYVDLGPVEIKQRFHYLSVPILAQFRIENDKIVPYVSLGPRIEYLLSHPESPVYDQFNKVELGGTIAAGVEVPLGFTPRMLAEISFNSNFTHAYRNENVTVDNRSFSFLVGILF